MDKSELVSKMMEDTKAPKKDMELVLKSFESNMVKSMTNGENVQLVGFGTFPIFGRVARKGINPN